ncbi:TPA: FecR domain-containing protein [Stenotrophomonas maltophilia]|nr:FecR domain-containing protein [Stenotrophomonas maltophilia]
MDDTDDIAGQQAHHWFARLRAPDCSAEDRAAFERWRADPQHAAAYANLEDLWAMTGDLAEDDPDIAAAVREARRADTRPWLVRQRWPLLATAASLLLVAGLLFLTLQPARGPVRQYATATGEQRTITLEDGSRVVLDTASRLDVQYGRRERSLVLRQGRADFHVSKDPARPFTVQAGAAAVTATGTQFQVRIDGTAGEVTLLEGRVVVASQQSAAETALSPGERIALRAGGALGAVERLSDADRANAEGWTSGQLVVQAWPVAALVAEVNRYGGTPLRLGDAAVGRLPVSGTFDPKAPEALALALEHVWPVRVEHGAGEIVLYERK